MRKGVDGTAIPVPFSNPADSDHVLINSGERTAREQRHLLLLPWQARRHLRGKPGRLSHGRVRPRYGCHRMAESCRRDQTGVCRTTALTAVSGSVRDDCGCSQISCKKPQTLSIISLSAAHPVGRSAQWLTHLNAAVRTHAIFRGPLELLPLRRAPRGRQQRRLRYLENSIVRSARSPAVAAALHRRGSL